MAQAGGTHSEETVTSFRYTRSLKVWDKSKSSLREEATNSVEMKVKGSEQALDQMLHPILVACAEQEIIKITVKTEGIRSQWLHELHLDFGVCRIDYTVGTRSFLEGSFSMIYEKVKHLVALKFLHLRYITVDQQDEQCLVEAIKNNPNLSVLFLGIVRFRDGSLLRQTLRQSKSITTLALIWLHLSDLPIRELLSELHQYKSIQTLVLLPFLANDTTWDSLENGLKRNTTLREFNLVGDADCRVTDKHIIRLAKNFPSSLHTLRLQNVFLQTEGMEAILRSSTTLTCLDISDSTLSTDALQTFKVIIPVLENLRCLDMQRVKRTQDPTFVSAAVLRDFLVSVSRHQRITSIDLTSSDASVISFRDFIIQRNKTRSLLVEESVGKFPMLLSSVAKKGWNTLLFYLLTERVDLLLHTTKRKAAHNDADQPAKRCRFQQEL